MAKNDNVKVTLDGPVWDEDGTLYRAGPSEIPRALAERLGLEASDARASGASGASEAEEGEEPPRESTPSKSAAKSTAKKGR